MIRMRLAVCVFLILCFISFALFQQNSFAQNIAKEETTQVGPEPVKKAVKVKIALGEEQTDEKEKKVISRPACPAPYGARIGAREEERASKKAQSKALTTIMSETFEGLFPQDNAWQLGCSINGYTWDDDDYRPHNGGWSGWCADGSYLGYPDLDPAYDNYPNYTNAWMVYGPFDLSNATSAELLFYYWNESEAGYDYFQWLASSDGNNFYGYQVSGYSGGWLYQNFDLTSVPTIGNLCGDSSVWIAFRFVSDYYITYRGAFVDDIVLRKEVVLLDVRVYPNEQAPGGNWYQWQGYEFTLEETSDIYIQLTGQAWSGSQNPSGGDDDLIVNLDGQWLNSWNAPDSIDGWSQWGRKRTINLTKTGLSPGKHILRLYADEKPKLYSLIVSTQPLPVELSTYPNEQAPGGKWYNWQGYEFTLDQSSDIYIQLTAQAWSGQQNPSGDDDDLIVNLDGQWLNSWNAPDSIDGWSQWGRKRTINLSKTGVAAGKHILYLYADEQPVLYSISVIAE